MFFWFRRDPMSPRYTSGAPVLESPSVSPASTLPPILRLLSAFLSLIFCLDLCFRVACDGFLFLLGMMLPVCPVLLLPKTSGEI
ncbi:hypothetical protein BDZ94DRAFT_1273297 [Collybia nuda]|uniref:Uncharacterized protein n=1 Tax=Collybia nuda TaxID=64659 RepID=A0A9P5XV58_9AGAR|nr:hypothetical protein BDZ94DRAFT_1273297 [Collybia nuda]